MDLDPGLAGQLEKPPCKRRYRPMSAILPSVHSCKRYFQVVSKLLLGPASRLPDLADKTREIDELVHLSLPPGRDNLVPTSL